MKLKGRLRMPRSRMTRALFATIFGLCLFAGLASAQSASSTINGLVQDKTGAVIPGAQVTITNQNTGARIQTVANNDGSFSMTSLQSGTYEVTITKEGFQRITERDVFVGPSVARSVNVTLTVGTVDTSVTVEASAAQVQTTTSQVSNYVAEKQIEELPLNGRNYQ